MNAPLVFITLGGLLLAGMAIDEIGRRTALPRVTMMILAGLAAGPAGMDLLPRQFQDWYDFLATAALSMVAFLLGGQLSLITLRRHGVTILAVSGAVVIATVVIVSAGLLAVGASLVLALLLAGIATATDPVATTDVVHQVRARGPFTTALLGIVAIDDAWGLIAFSLVLLAAKAIVGDGALSFVAVGLWEVFGAFALGAAIGIPAAYLTGRLHPGQPIQAEALGIVFLCAGLALWLEVSFLLAGMTAGAFVVNRAKHHQRPFHEIERIELPFMVLFFVLAGAELRFDSLGAVGLVGFAYLALRILARVVGGWVGATLAGAPVPHCRWFGPALMSQAGVGIGMALVAAENFPELGDELLAVTIGVTVLFELIGPIFVSLALRRTGEASTRPAQRRSGSG